MTLKDLTIGVDYIEHFGHRLNAMTIDYASYRDNVTVHVDTQTFAHLMEPDTVIKIDEEFGEHGGAHTEVYAPLGARSRVFCLLPDKIKTVEAARAYLESYRDGYDQGTYDQVAREYKAKDRN